MTNTITATFGKLLNTVGTVADAATKIVDNTASGLDMLDMYVRTAKQKQHARTEGDMATFYQDLQNELKLEAAMKETALRAELDSNPKLKAAFDSYHDTFETILNDVKAQYKA